MLFLRLSVLLLALAGPCGAAFADAPINETSALARLKADLLANPSATQVLTKWCGDLRLATPAVIRAERDLTDKPATPEIRTLLGAANGEAIRYRRVRLMCGTHILSQADNWYRPSQLTPAMNKALDESDTPFGTVVRPLGFSRRTLDAATNAEPGTVLRVRALLLAGAAPFSLVVENYRPDLIAPPGH
jgi:chorismate-pyruvate lyase